MYQSICILVIFISATSKFAVSAKDVFDNKPLQLVNIGSVDGKTFFADNSTSRSRGASKDFCESNGLKLASITSQAQHDFIGSVTSSWVKYMGYWLSAMETQSRSQFKWDEASIDDGSVGDYGNTLLPVTKRNACLMYSTGDEVWYIYPCDGTWYVFCEMST